MVNTNQQVLHTPKATPNMQTSVPQQHSVVSDMSIVTPGSGNNNKATSMVSAHKAPHPVQNDNSNLRRSNRVSKPNSTYLDVVSLVENS